MDFITGNLPMIIIGIVVLFLLFGGIFTVSQQEARIIERFGKFNRVARPGLRFKIPLIESKSYALSLRIEELDIPGTFKSKDNSFVKITIRVQHSVIEGQESDAYYKLSDPHQQITAFVLDVTRATVAGMALGDVFEHQTAISGAVTEQLGQRMKQYGFEIHSTLVNEVTPSDEVITAMNQVIASQNMKTAAQNEGEATKIRSVLEAEAEAESKRLQGEGIAKQRSAIIEGLQTSIKAFETAVPDVKAPEVMQLVLLTQYFDTMKELGHGNAKVIYVDPSPNGLASITRQIQAGMMIGGEALSTPASPPETPKES